MTVVAYEPTEHQLQQLVASADYVASVVRTDKVRLLGIADAAKGLIKTLTAPVTDLALWPGPMHLLAVATADGAISVHRLTTVDTSVNTEPVAALTVVNTTCPRVAWHPAAPDVLLFCSSHVVHVAVLSQLAPGAPTVVDATAMHLPAGVYSLPWGAVGIDALASNLAIAHDGSMAAVATTDGRVVVFDLAPLRSVNAYLDDLQGPACGVRGTVEPFGGEPAAVLAWLSRDVGRSQVGMHGGAVDVETLIRHTVAVEKILVSSMFCQHWCQRAVITQLPACLHNPYCLSSPTSAQPHTPWYRCWWRPTSAAAGCRSCTPPPTRSLPCRPCS